MTLRILDLCAGIGGFSYAAEYLSGGDYETAAFVEIDEYCQQVLRARWPDTPIYDDVKEYQHDKETDGRIDIITAGYPCQPFSAAGKREGQTDDRHLWPNVFEIIQSVRPSWAIFENVYGHVNLGLADVLDDLGSEGYTAQTLVIPACATDAGHPRQRTWIIATYEQNNVAHNGDTFYQLTHKENAIGKKTLSHTPTAKANKLSPSLALRSGGLGKRLLRTPVSQLGTGGQRGGAERLLRGERQRDSGHKIQVSIEHQLRYELMITDGYFNAEWVEWYMGYPTGWTTTKNITFPKGPLILTLDGALKPRTSS